MSFVYADRVKETTQTSFAGTGDIQLNGTSTGFITFVDGIGNSNECYYVIDDAAGNWEVGVGTVTSGSPDTISRDTVIASSNAGAKVSFSTGAKDVACTQTSRDLPTMTSADAGKARVVNSGGDGFDMSAQVIKTGAFDDQGAGNGLDADTVDGLEASEIEDNVVPDGNTVNMVFEESTAPTGWTQDTAHNDLMPRIVNGTGAGTGGSWTISGLTMGSHTHSVGFTSQVASGSTVLTDNTGGNSVTTLSHTHQVTGTTGFNNISGINSSGAWRPAYLDLIICNRD